VKNRTFFFTRPILGLALLSLLSGCGYVKSYRARIAYGHYQTALAAGDLLQARNALLTLVQTQQDVAPYWIELGKLQLQMGAYREAYDAFSHAYELDRSNADVLSTMAQMALMSGDVDVANEHANALALITPDSPIVTIVRGYVALKSGELDKAEQQADTVLASYPNQPFATVLKGRVFIAENRLDDAIALLEDQHRSVPQDMSAIKGLTEIYRARDDWGNVARVQSDAHRLDPKDSSSALTAIEAFLRAGNIAAAATMSAPLLSPATDPQLIDNVLQLWARFAPPHTSLPNGMNFANAVNGDRRVAFANYYNAISHPTAAAALLHSEQTPVTHSNARWNAVFAQSLALRGKSDEARRLFDLVLEREPDQAEALRGRSSLESKIGQNKRAVIDAQRLVTISPNSGEDRVVLARAFLAAGNGDQVRRTLWDAFRDLPDDERVFSALKSVLASTGDADGLRRLNDEFNDRRGSKLLKDLV
jgi:predicted Zn-dependent protease